jgi:hypothetical protein
MFLKKYTELPNNLFGLLYWNIFGIYFLVFICLGLLAVFEIKPVEFNGEPTYGVVGLLVSLIMAPFMSLVTAFTVWLLLIVGNFILKIVTKLKK